MTGRRIKTLLAAIPLVAACATSGGTTRELIEARNAYARAATSSAAVEAPQSLAYARQSLTVAEIAHQERPGSERERHLAYLAHRRAQIAMAQADARIAERTAQLAREGYERRAREAAQAAEVAKQQAEHEAQQREAAQRQLETTRQELDRLETELADTRRQLTEKGDQLDEQTRQLEARAAALQAQVDTLRGERGRLQVERDKALETIREFAKVEEEQRGLVITMPSEVMFRSDSATLLPIAKEKLDELAAALEEIGSDQTFIIEGHTDSRGASTYNRRLSKRRANAVRAYLIEQGVDRDQIIARGRGEDEPVASNADPEGRANNRRVEVVVSPQRTVKR